MLALIVLFSLGYFILAEAHTVSDLGETVQFALHQLVRPFAVLIPVPASGGGSWVATMLGQYPVLLRVLATVQSLIGIGLLTLFVLALRRRFRMG